MKDPYSAPFGYYSISAKRMHAQNEKQSINRDFVTESGTQIGYDKDTKEVETMKEYVCTVCGYVHKGELSDDF